MKQLFYFLSVIVLVSSCGSKQERHGFTLSGKVTNNTEKTLYLQELTPRGLRPVDSAVVQQDGSFEFKGTVTEKTFCTITFPKGPVIIAIDTNSTLNININADNPDKVTVAGSPETELLIKMLDINSKYMQMMRGLETKYAQYANGEIPSPEVQNKIRNDYDSIMTNRTKELQDFVLSLDKSVVPYFATNFLMPESDFEFLEKVDQKFYPTSGHSKYAKELHERVEELRKIAVGQVAPDIVLNDPFDKQIALSSKRGKYVLVDFWASWCKPCRQESPALVKMYNKYKTRGFDIFSVSLDEDRNAWQKAINDDKLLWTHVSDLKKWNSEIVRLYKIDAIPHTILLDKDGKIIAKNLRGEKLMQKLQEIFGY